MQRQQKASTLKGHSDVCFYQECLSLVENRTHLLQGSFSCGHFIQHKQRNEWEGDGGDEPANDVSPEWVNIGLAEPQWGVFDNREEESSLWKQQFASVNTLTKSSTDIWFTKLGLIVLLSNKLKVANSAIISLWTKIFQKGSSRNRWRGWCKSNSTLWMDSGDIQSCLWCFCKNARNLQEQGSQHSQP